MTYDIPSTRCAIYTRKSTTNRLDAEVNSLTTQREVCSAYITSQKYKSWLELPTQYDDGGKPGSNLDRPALAALMHDIEQGSIDVVVVYKIDRLTRSLVDFVRLIDLFDKRKITLVSISQAFDTSDSMGRMVLNILLTFSQFEREMIGERVRESLRARKRHGKLHGGKPPFGYQLIDDELVVDENEAHIVRFIFDEFIRTERYVGVQRSLEATDFKSSVKPLRKGGTRGGMPLSSSVAYGVLHNPVYVGEIRGHESNYPGRHQAIISREVWDAAHELTKARRKQKPGAKGTGHFLAGLLRDELGRSMRLDVKNSESYAHNYYKSTDAKWSRTEYLRAYRAHAGRLDELAIAIMAEFLRDRIRLRRALKKLGVGGAALERLAEAGSFAAERLQATDKEFLPDLFEALVVGIEVGKGHLNFNIRSWELQRFLEWDDNSVFRARRSDWPLSDANYEFSIEVRAIAAERWSSLNIKPKDNGAATKPNRGLIALIESAREAQQLVQEHRELTVAELAKKMRIRPSMFARLVRINYLAPDIVTGILDGTQPEELTRKRLMYANLPTDWSLQRALLGFEKPTRELPNYEHKGLWPTKKTEE